MSQTRSFKYRLVPFGTNFELKNELRTPETVAQHSDLFQNEIATDVGGELLNELGQGMVFDHHFLGAPAPSAAAVVLQQARRIEAVEPSTIGLVTHSEPDFDALCSIFLARSILDGSLSASSLDCDDCQGDWWLRDSLTQSVPKNLSKWAVMLAAYASRIDQCVPIPGGISNGLHSALYMASRRRGSDWGVEQAMTFFEQVRDAIENGANPFFDDLVAEMPAFRNEKALLEKDFQHYRNDLRRARISTVTVPVWRRGWSKDVIDIPLLDTQGEINPVHTGVDEPRKKQEGEINVDHTSAEEAEIRQEGDITPEHIAVDEPGKKQAEVDAVFIRDPRSLMFKDWARSDLEGSSQGRGFVFTAVAYSGKYPERANTSEYYFALNPEVANGAHLYPLWARLQKEEMNAEKIKTPHRIGFEKREVGEDPWYDGMAFNSTIVVTPKRGTAITNRSHYPSAGTPTSSDLSDDPIADIVSAELEWSSFTKKANTEVTVIDFSLVKSSDSESAKSSDSQPSFTIGNAVSAGISKDHLRFAKVPLCEGAKLEGVKAAEIAQRLWPILEKPGVRTRPLDFESRHVVYFSAGIAVWSRSGIAVAYREGAPDGEALPAIISDDLKHIASIFQQIDSVLRSKPGTAMDKAQVLEIQQSLSRLRSPLMGPEGVVRRRLLDALQFERVLESYYAFAVDQSNDRRQQAGDLLNLGLACVAFVGLLYSWFQVEHLTMLPEKWAEGYKVLVGLTIAVLAIIVPRLVRGRSKEKSDR